MVQYPDSFLDSGKVVYEVISSGKVQESKAQLAHALWNLSGYGLGTVLPVSTSVGGSDNVEGVVIIKDLPYTDEQALDFLSSLPQGSDGAKGFLDNVAVQQLAKWALEYLLTKLLSGK